MSGGLITGELRSRAIALFGQQLWFWGRDVVREEGNWLLESGFERERPPEMLERCSSVYTRELPGGRRVVLRGFGVFYGEDSLGGVFLRRDEFQPRYTLHSAPESPPWEPKDLPKFESPGHPNWHRRAGLTLKLIRWIEEYETDIRERLGVDYRHDSLVGWDNGRRQIVPVDEMIVAWQSLSDSLAAHFGTGRVRSA